MDSMDIKSGGQSSSSSEVTKRKVLIVRPDLANNSEDDVASESSSLLRASTSSEEPLRKPNASRGRKTKSTGSVSSELSSHPEVSQADEMLLESFYAHLDRGIVLKLHKEKSPGAVKTKQMKMSLVGNELRWQLRGKIINKTGTVSMTLVRKIQWGKRTVIFNLPANKDVDENCCFSLVTDSYTIDLECSSRLERDVMARGFSILIAVLEGGSVK